MTKAQEVFERVEALVASGTKKADAFRQVAEEFGQPFNSMRGAYYAHTRSTGQAAPRTRKRQTTTEDAIASAVTALNRAVAAIDSEIDAAKTRAEEAQAEYEHLRDTAEERKAAIQAKIEALSA
jgi:predicted RNase H-like nuclease (RuvC/YqgF family)